MRHKDASETEGESIQTVINQKCYTGQKRGLLRRDKENGLR